MQAYIRFQSVPDKWYPVVISNTFTDRYDETLSTKTAIISHLENDELKNVKSQQFATIRFNNTYKRFFVDSIISEKTNISSKPFWTYTITLFSLIKFFEKIQLPNKCFTHNLDSETDDRLTIHEAINQLMILYNPLGLFYNGETTDPSYKYFIRYNNENLVPDRAKTTKLKDIQLSKPTLRQAITAIMSQIGCIPYIDDDLNLRYLDFTERPAEYNLDDLKITSFRKSMASDSTISSLVNMGEQVIDFNHTIKREAIGFRDPENAILSQTKNLKLNVSLPIYKVKKLETNVNKSIEISLTNLMYRDPASTGDYSLLYETGGIAVSKDLKNAYVRLDLSSIQGAHIQIYLNDIQITYLNGQVLSTIDIEQKFVDLPNVSVANTQIYIIQNDSVPDGANTISIKFKLSIYNIDGNETYKDTRYIYCIYPVLNNGSIDDTYDMALNFAQLDNSSQYGKFNTNTLIKIDVTDLCVEANKRKLLSSDFLSMKENKESLSQYVMGTVEYQLGGKEITGFSTVYAETNGWWQISQTYWENIENVLFKTDSNVQQQILNQFNIPYDWYILAINSSKHDRINFGNFEINPNTSNYVFDYSFNIEYYPLNTVHIKYDKDEDIPLRIEQLDTSENGLSAMNDLSKTESDKLDRLGQVVYNFSMRVNSFNGLLPLGSKINVDDEENFIIFQRQYSIENGFLQVNYTGSQDYVITNYSTAIQTKYRAYQYVDYNQAVIRKENKKFYVIVAKAYNTKDLLNYNYFTTKYNFAFITLFFPFFRQTTFDVFYYQVGGDYYINDLSTTTYKNNIVFSELDFDSASYGLHILNKPQLGGVPQEWYIKDLPQTSATFGLGNIIDFNFSNAEDYVLNSPKININTNKPYLFVNMITYQDVSEQLGITLQFELFFTKQVKKELNIETTEWLTSLAVKQDVTYYIVTGEEAKTLNNEPYDTKPTNIDSNMTNYISYSSNILAFNFPNNVINVKLVGFINNKYYDLMNWSNNNSPFHTYPVFTILQKSTKLWEDDDNILTPENHNL